MGEEQACVSECVGVKSIPITASARSSENRFLDCYTEKESAECELLLGPAPCQTL